ncbi:cytochrome P450 [Nonomuraea wenchangensis]|uniref:cytochrome P450 n=1 Tax=Nonomuraea wenchangensis TaxID=568860 RepID=UPI0033345210
MSVITYSPYDYAMHEDPYPTYARLRKEAPLYRNSELDFWALTRHADVHAAGRDPATYSNSHGVSLELWSPEMAKRSSFIAMDPPEHSRFRALISRGFTPRRVTELEPFVRRITRERLRAVLDAGGDFDFIHLVQDIPADVISELVGVPAADRAQILRWSNESLLREEGSGAITQASATATLNLVGYYQQLIADRRARPGDDLVSALIAAEIDGVRLSDADIGAVLLLLGIAGNESTTKILGNAWLQAARHPDQRRVVFESPARIADWVEETLRHDSSGQMAARLVTREVELHGTVVPAGARMLLIYAAANRDPAVFPDPDVFDLDRDRSRTLAFGTGPHFCLGASLARMETRVVLEELVAAVHEDYQVGAPVRVHHPNIHGLSGLPTSVKAR